MKASHLILVLTFVFSQFHVSSQSLCDQYGNEPIDIVINTSNASSLNANDLKGKHILWIGQVRLDQDLMLEDCFIRVEGAGYIYGDQSFNNEEVTLKNVKIYSCTGVIANFVRTGFSSDTGRPRLTIQNCIFENFLELFHINGGQYDIRNSIFQNPSQWNNHIIHIPFHDPEDQALRPMHFSGNTFRDIRKVFTIENSDNVKIGSNHHAQNTFINCGFGGAGVFEFEGSNSNSLTFESTQIINNKFFHCNKVVIGGGKDLVVLNNNDFVESEIAALDIGPTIVSPDYVARIFYALDNTFQVSGNPNAIFLSKFRGNTTLRNNEITYYSTPGTSGASSVRISGGGDTYAYRNIFKNYDIANSYIGNESFFIDVSSNNKFVARENKSEGGMIRGKGISNVEFYDNEVNARGSKYAITNSLSNGKLCNNSGKDATFIFSFFGNCMDTDFTNNEIGISSGITTGKGLFVDQVFGQQPHKANLWHGTFTDEGATNTSNATFLSLIKVNSDQSTGGNPFFKPANNAFSPFIWFDEDSNTFNFSDCTSTYLIDPNDPRKNVTYVDEKVIDGTFNLSTLSNWLSIRNLIRKLDNYPYILNNLNANNWYIAMQNTPVADIASIENLLAIYYGDENEVNDIRDLIEDYILFTDELDQMESSSNNYQTTLNSYNIVRADISNIQNQIKVRQAEILTDVHNILVPIIPTNDFEAIFKDVYSIYIKMLAEADYILSNTEIQIISETSNLCPLSYGPSIYIAQNIAEVYNIVYDENNCSELRTRSSKKVYTNYVNIFPNPASELITIESSFDNPTIKIYNAQMIEVISVKRKLININSLPNGLYTVIVNSEDSVMESKKLIIIK